MTTSRGWQRERVVTTADTTGTPVAVITGVTTDQDGRVVAVLAVGDGPSAVLDQPAGDCAHGKVGLNVVHALLDVEERRARAERRRGLGQR